MVNLLVPARLGVVKVRLRMSWGAVTFVDNAGCNDGLSSCEWKSHVSPHCSIYQQAIPDLRRLAPTR